MIAIVRKALSFKSQHICQNWTKFIDYLKNGHCFFYWMNDFLHPIRYHYDFMNNLPNVTKRLDIKT